jgi:hypothetical protein
LATWLRVRDIVILGDTHLSLKIVELQAHQMFEIIKLDSPGARGVYIELRSPFEAQDEST